MARRYQHTVKEYQADEEVDPVMVQISRVVGKTGLAYRERPHAG